MEIQRLSNCPPKNPSLPVKFTEMGNIIEVQYMSRRNYKATIQMLPGLNEYVELSTGEIKECKHHTTRADQKKSLLRTFANLRAIINTNIVDVSKVRFITLTYAENMTDTKRLYLDTDKFMKRFKYYCKTNGYGLPEFITVTEPQGRGAWHLHILMIFNNTAPFIKNEVLANLWGYGFVRITKLDDVDNVGAYLTAYLGDIEISENHHNTSMNDNIKILDVEDDTGKVHKKYFLKGGRLSLYPAKFRIYRCSRGIKRPIPEMISQEDADDRVRNYEMTFETTISLSDEETEFEAIINKTYYNRLRRNNNDIEDGF